MNGYFQPNTQMTDLQSQLNNLIASYNQLNQNRPTLSPPVPDVPEIQWVKGIEGAKAPKLKPNTRVVFFDEDDAVFYLRSVDANGIESPMKIGRFTLEDPPVPEDNTVTKQDLLAFKEEIKQMLSNSQRFQNGQKNNFVQNQEVKK